MLQFLSTRVKALLVAGERLLTLFGKEFVTNLLHSGLLENVHEQAWMRNLAQIFNSFK